VILALIADFSDPYVPIYEKGVIPKSLTIIPFPCMDFQLHCDLTGVLASVVNSSVAMT